MENNQLTGTIPAAFGQLTGMIIFWILSFINYEKIEKKDFGRIAICGLLGAALNMIMFFKGLSLTTPINAALIMLLSPIIVLNNNKKEFVEYLCNSLIYVEKGVDLLEKLSTKDKSINNKNLRSIPYNGCCALSLLSEQEGNINEDQKIKIFDLFKINISLNPNKSHAREIMKVSDFAFALEKIGKEIIKKFKLQ